MGSQLTRAARYGSGALLIAFAFVYLVWFPFRPHGPAMADFSAYYAAGRAWSRAENPFGPGIWAEEQRVPGVNPARRALLPFVGPPLGLPLWAALGSLPYRLAAWVWGAIVAASAAFIVVLPARLAGRRVRRDDIIALLLFAIVCGPLVTGIAVGQAALPAIAAVDLAVVFAATRRWLPMIGATIAATMFKPNDALVLVGVVRELATLLALGGSALASLLANVVFAGGWQGLGTYLQVLAVQSAAERFYVYQLTPTSIAYSLGLSPDGAVLTGSCVALAALVALAVAVRCTRANAVDAVAIACAAFPFAVPFEHEPDLVLLLLPALLVVFRARGWTWAIGGASTVLVCISPFAMAQGRLGLAFTALTATVAALQLAALVPAERREVRLAPLAVVPLVVLIAFFAPRHRLPLWPDALPPHAAVVPNASAGAEWHDELVASGLERRHPWAAALRLLTLCGCAGVGLAMLRVAAAARPVDAPSAERRQAALGDARSAPVVEGA